MSGNDIDSLAKRHAEVLHELEQVRARHKEAMELIEKHREENQLLKSEKIKCAKRCDKFPTYTKPLDITLKFNYYCPSCRYVMVVPVDSYDHWQIFNDDCIWEDGTEKFIQCTNCKKVWSKALLKG